MSESNHLLLIRAYDASVKLALEDAKSEGRTVGRDAVEKRVPRADDQTIQRALSYAAIMGWIDYRPPGWSVGPVAKAWASSDIEGPEGGIPDVEGGG